MKEQPIPKVSFKDVKRIAIRDFGEERLSEVLSILDDYKIENNNKPSPRVQLAILKIADGDINELTIQTKNAIIDFRDVIAYAEYPRYSIEIGFKDVDDELKKRVIEEDWQQYSMWLEE